MTSARIPTPYRDRVLHALRHPRYAAFAALMAVVAVICVLAGTWQVARFREKHAANNALRHNAHQAPTPVQAVLPVVPARAAPDAVQFRRVTATGNYDAVGQVLVRRQQVNDINGYYVLTPLRTPTATLLVVRGFVAQPTAGPPSAAPPPAGTVSVTARAEPPAQSDDKGAQLTGQVETINPAQQAARLRSPVYDGYADLLAGQPGTANLVPIPEPDLSNPAGGAVEPQHIAYIVQWYLFAALALAAPVVMIRAESRRPASGDIDALEGSTVEDARAARLADRYGRSVTRRETP
jgi:cytochrome oxidase assembly protein ShyY1